MEYRVGKNMFLASGSLLLGSLIISQLVNVNTDVIILLCMATIITGFYWANVMFGNSEHRNYFLWIGTIALTLISVIALAVISAEKGNAIIYQAYLIAACIQVLPAALGYARQKAHGWSMESAENMQGI